MVAKGLTKNYGSLEIFTGVDLAIDKGSRVVVLGLNGALTRAEGPFVAGLHSGPAAGRIWRPDDRLPEPDDDAVLSIVDVEELAQAWEVFTFLVSIEQALPDPDGEEPTMIR